MYRVEDAQDPFTRASSYGFRCAVYSGNTPIEAFAPITHPMRDYRTEKPVKDETFDIFRRMYAYDQTALDVRAEGVDELNEHWRKEKISYRAAYGDERIPAFLYLPRNARPPYKAVLWAPGGYATLLRSSETGLPTEYFKFLLRTGRAVLYPVYKGTFERRIEAAGPQRPSGYDDPICEGCLPLGGLSGESPGYRERQPGILRAQYGGNRRAR